MGREEGEVMVWSLGEDGDVGMWREEGEVMVWSLGEDGDVGTLEMSTPPV
jgi:hypothetical protein